MPDLGIKNGALKPCPTSPNCVCSQVNDGAHYIEPLRFAGSPQEAHDRIVNVVESEKRTKIVTAEANYIRAEFTSALFRFVDDVEFYFPEGTADETEIHIRSASRIGYSDLGANRKRMERIRSLCTQ